MTTQLRRPLSAGALDEYVIEVVETLNGGANAATLVTALRAFDSAVDGDVVKQRLSQVLDGVLKVASLSSGQVVSATVGTAGTGYEVGDSIPVSGDGEGALAVVSEVDTGGEVLAVEIIAGGVGYTAATADATDSGDGLADITLTVSNQAAALATARATINAA